MKFRTALVALAAALLSSCSAMKLAYTNADTYLIWQADRFFDLTSAEKTELRGKVNHLMAWHRREELPKYAVLADQAGARVARGVSAEDIHWITDAVTDAMRDTLTAAARDTAPLVDRLTPEQIAHLESRLARENRTFARDFLEPPAEERRDKRFKRTRDTLEDWVGRLNDGQLERVRRYSHGTALNDEARDARRKRLQAEFIQIARNKEAQRRLAAWTAKIFPSDAEAVDPSLRANQAEYRQMLLDLDRSLTPDQRQKAVARFRDLAEDFRTLARPPQASAPQS